MPRFCNGCPINLDDECIGNNVSLLGIDWDTATLNLKYQQALERVCVCACASVHVCPCDVIDSYVLSSWLLYVRIHMCMGML